MSRRRKKRPQPHSAPNNAAPEVFSEQEMDFFRRGDELHPPSADEREAPEADA